MPLMDTGSGFNHDISEDMTSIMVQTILFALKNSWESSLISSLTIWLFWNFVACCDPRMKIGMLGGGECQCDEKFSVQPIKQFTKQIFTNFNVYI